MIVKKDKIIKISLLLLLTTIITYKKPCNAFEVSFASLSDGQTLDEIKDAVEPQPWSEVLRGGTKGYKYTYKKLITSHSSINMNGYNANGESVMPESNIVTHEFKVGTWIGINIFETQTANWYVYDFKHVEVQKKYTCKYSYSGGTTTCNSGSAAMSQSACDAKRNEYDNVSFEQFYPGYGLCRYSNNCSIPADTQTRTHIKDYWEIFECPTTIYHNYHTYYIYESPKPENIEGEEIPGLPASIADEVEQTAIAEAEQEAIYAVGTSMGQVNYITNNKYPSNNTDVSYGSLIATKIDDLQSSGSGTREGKYWQNYEYRQEKVCMNVKTAKITYGRNCNISNGEVQIENGEITDGKKYWHYFIPLNTKTGNEQFYIQVANSASKVSAGKCKSAMNKYENYEDYIVPYEENIEGVENKFLGKEFQEVDENTIELNDGCYFFTTVYIPVVQKFYNEIKSGTNNKLKGFNLYYKPIDINNPFPNGVSDNSLWKEWNENTNKKPNLTQSYSQKTYKALDINAKNIRNYNKNNLYTDWSNMKLDGTSNFITDYGILREGTINVYKLGCGPLNVNEYLLDEYGEQLLDASGNPIKNKLYLKACGNS